MQLTVSRVGRSTRHGSGVALPLLHKLRPDVFFAVIECAFSRTINLEVGVVTHETSVSTTTRWITLALETREKIANFQVTRDNGRSSFFVSPGDTRIDDDRIVEGI